jgi:hypothetical protein
MKKILVLLSFVLLAGCNSLAPLTQKTFPNVPDELKVACPDLGQINPDTTKLSEVIGVVTDNFSQYHECRVKVDAWIEWYTNQSTLYNSVK